MISLESLSKRFDSITAVDDVSLEVEDGETLVLLGGSGSGKTTTLKTINRLIEPSSGRIRLQGEDVLDLAAHDLRRRIGYVFQQLGLFPHMTVAENVGITPSLLKWDRKRIEARVRELIELVELPEHAASRRPAELSGGQQQRVAVARALAAEPSVMLLDEPFGALDPLTRERLQESFQRIRAELGLTCVFVTHDIVEAITLGDRLAMMNAGRLVQVGTAEELLNRPADEYVEQMMSTARHFADRVEQVSGEES